MSLISVFASARSSVPWADVCLLQTRNPATMFHSVWVGVILFTEPSIFFMAGLLTTSFTVAWMPTFTRSYTGLWFGSTFNRILVKVTYIVIHDSAGSYIEMLTV